MNDETNKRPPAFPKELLDRTRPRGVLRAEEFANQVDDRSREKIQALEQALTAALETHMAVLELLNGIHEHITETVALMDARQFDAARKGLDRAVIMLDGVDFSFLLEKKPADAVVEKLPPPPAALPLSPWAEGLADFLISHSGTIAGAKARLLKGGVEEARSTLSDTVDALLRHLENSAATKNSN